LVGWDVSLKNVVKVVSLGVFQLPENSQNSAFLTNVYLKDNDYFTKL
jgi:hypothetical protein